MGSEKRYEGDVVFVDGVHYPAAEVETDAGTEIGADLERPLRWDAEQGAYRSAKKDDELHNDVHHVADAALEPRVIAVAAPGQEVYPAGVSVVTDPDDHATYFLLDDHERPQTDHPLRWDGELQAFVPRDA